MKPSSSLAVFSLLVAWSQARADDKNAATCSETYVRAQTLRNEHKLIEARETLRACVRSACKAFVVRDCATWLDQVQSSLPTVVPVAIDGAGNDLGGVKVSMDGRVLLERIDGRSVEVDPGPHTFSFEGPDGHLDKQVIVAEGEKGKRIAVLLGKPAPAPVPIEAGAGTADLPPVAQSGMGPWKTVGLVTLGAGVVGAGIGAFFGLRAVSDKNDANCDANSVCPSPAAANTLSDAQHEGTLATVFLVSGGILAAGGVTLFILAPARPVRATPNLGRGELGFTLRGDW